MFSLIITIVSIALVAALALATLYYGGEAFGKGAARAEASKILLQGQQLVGAADLYFTDKRVWPASINDLVSDGYLKQVPSADASGLAAAIAAGTTWSMPIPGTPMFLTSAGTNPDACAEVNVAGSLRKRGILAHAYTGLIAQCYGSTPATLRTVFKKAPETALTDGTVGLPADEIRTGNGPTDPTDPAWYVRPGAATPPAGGGSSGGSNGGGGTTPPATGVLSVSPLTLDFGTVAAGEQSTLQVQLSNTGNGPLTLAQPAALASGGAFSLESTDCGPSLAAGANCTVSVTYAPALAATNVTGTLNVYGADAGTPTEVSLAASASGAPLLVLDRSSINFGLVNVGTSNDQVLTVTNEGTDVLAFANASSLTGPSTFSRSSTCGPTLAVGASCTVTIRYQPAGYDENASATLRVFGAAASEFQDVTLAGTSNKAAFVLNSVSPTAYDPVGGAAMSVSGQNFDSSTQVSVDGAAVSCSLVSATTLNCTAPAHAAGTVAVTVSDPADSARTATLASSMTYVALAYTSMTQTDFSTVGGQRFTVTGTGFQAGMTVRFGTALATNCSLTGYGATSAYTSMQCDSPALAAGAHSMTLANPSGSTLVRSNQVTYTTPITYATFDAARKHANITLSNGNLTATIPTIHGTGTFYTVAGTVPKASGKYYFEVTGYDSVAVGYASTGCGFTSQGILANNCANAVQFINGTQYAGQSNNGGSFGNTPTGTVIGVAIDIAAKSIQVRIKTPGGACGALSAAQTMPYFSGSSWVPAISMRADDATRRTATANFGASAFACSVPTGYQAGWY